MPISSETITGTGSSSIANATASVSEFLVQGDYKGYVYFQYRVATGDWHNITSGQGRFKGVVPSPDSSLEYRFNARSIVGNAVVYFGP